MVPNPSYELASGEGTAGESTVDDGSQPTQGELSADNQACRWFAVSRAEVIVCATPSNWEQALAYCEGLEAVPAVVTDAEIDQFVRSAIAEADAPGVWIGLQATSPAATEGKQDSDDDTAKPRTFAWIDRSVALTFTAWIADEPKGKEPCVSAGLEGWATVRCTTTYPLTICTR